MIDRRVRRTRTALYDALVRLIRQGDFDQITVDDILAEADVGRSTFYAHFRSKDDLLARSLERLRDELLAAQAQAGRGPPSLAFFRHVAAYADVQAALGPGRGAVIVRDAIDEVVLRLLRSSRPGPDALDVPRELAIRHGVASLTTVVTWWLEQWPKVGAEEAHALLVRLLADGPAAAVCRDFMVGSDDPAPDAAS